MKISSRPVKEYIISSLIKHDSPDNLARRTAIQSHSMTSPYVKWIDGVVYRILNLTFGGVDERLTEQFVDNGIIWVDIEYAEMPTFTSTINSPQENIVVPVINNSSDSNEKALITWIKDDSQQAYD